MGLLTALPVFAAEPQEGALVLCRRLVEESREVDRLLRTVSDRESGQAVAAALRSKMEFLQQGAGQLSQMPLSGAEAARQLEQLMRDLMHVTQGYMPVVHRLVEVNAYGSEELLSLFQFYKMSAAAAANAARSGESLVVRSCNEWCDSIDDMLYQLRRVQDFATAQTVAGGELVSLIRRVERLAVDVESQQLGLSPQQLESEPLPKARLKFLQGELRNEVLRLQKAGCYGAAQLTPLLEACLKAARD
ncbi:MAG: hypothetical protein IKT79_05150 [Akkermansia sp.]|nr:hypothetical protein [Akkermansia sp.]